MKKSLTKQKAQTSKIPYSKATMHKISYDLSMRGTKKNFVKNKNDSINKETFEGSCVDNQTYGLNLDSLNSSKLTISKNHSLGKLDNKLILFNSSLNNSFGKKIKNLKFSKSSPIKNKENFSENISSSSEDEEIISMNNLECNEDEDNTNKIDYRFYPKIPEIEINKENNTYFWLATYDRLMKKSKIVKILNYYTDSLSHKESEIFIIEDENSDYKDYKAEENKEIKKKMNEKYNFKEKTMIIQGYELYFVKKHGKPFVRQKEGGKLFIKLYLLSLEQINQIFSYINRLEYKSYINNLDSFTKKNTFIVINTLNKTIYNYSKVFFLGAYMNINIYLFSHSQKSDFMENDYNENIAYNINDLPSSNKIAKLIKALMLNFPDFSKKYFIEYLMKPKDNNNIEINVHDKEILEQKMKEVNLLLITNNKNIYKSKINNINNIVKNIINGIPTNTPSSFYNPNDLNSIGKSIQNNNILKGIEINSSYNNSSNNELNCSDFLSNIKSELDGISIESKSNFYKNTGYDFKRKQSKPLSKIKLNNVSYTRNINNTLNKNMSVNTNISSMKTIYSLKGKINNNSKICKTISLMNPSKKFLTSNNSNKVIRNKIIQKNKNKSKSIKKNLIQNKKDNSIQNKENNSFIANKNIFNGYKTINKDIFYNKKIEHLFKKSDSRKTFKSTRNKINVYSPFHTNTNSNNNDISSQNTILNLKSREPIKLLSTIKKVISQKMSGLSDNTSTFSNNLLKLESNSNSSYKDSKTYNNNEYSNYGMNSFRYNKIYRIKKNSQNQKLEEYITPLKKKFFYYYK